MVIRIEYDTIDIPAYALIGLQNRLHNRQTSELLRPDIGIRLRDERLRFFTMSVFLFSHYQLISASASMNFFFVLNTFMPMQ
jgi:hypothetical protein